MKASEISYRKTRIHIKSMVDKAANEKVCYRANISVMGGLRDSWSDNLRCGCIKVFLLNAMVSNERQRSIGKVFQFIEEHYKRERFVE